ncbi:MULTISPECIES: cytochrome b [Thalassospira]|uniref:Cytochrome b n=1 Tax=Thalassospira aquimaris TaxID=3037796 RepID=A0ABT6GB85_9PROT|nr:MULTISPECIES: cytochrome b [Thalassospira]MDG4719283.1 cytochrome b [Thalassospira sp. FZY0004]
MALRSNKTGFGSITKSLHWVMAALFISVFAMGWYMDFLPLGMAKLEWMSRHKSFGVTILTLAVLRIVWRLSEPTPDALGKHAIERLAAKVGHLGLYAVMLAMPLTGWMMSSAANFPVSVFGLFTLPNLVAPDQGLFEAFKTAHFLLSWVIVALVLGHVAAALKHHFIDRDATLRRMLPVSGNNDADIDATGTAKESS